MCKTYLQHVGFYQPTKILASILQMGRTNLFYTAVLKCCIAELELDFDYFFTLYRGLLSFKEISLLSLSFK